MVNCERLKINGSVLWSDEKDQRLNDNGLSVISWRKRTVGSGAQWSAEKIQMHFLWIAFLLVWFFPSWFTWSVVQCFCRFHFLIIFFVTVNGNGFMGFFGTSNAIFVALLGPSLNLDLSVMFIREPAADKTCIPLDNLLYLHIYSSFKLQRMNSWYPPSWWEQH